MSQVQPLSTQGMVRAGIQRAAARTGVDFDYLMGQASLESRLDPAARAPNSSASGLFQFLSSTWLGTVQKHGAKHGLGWASAQIEQTGQGAVVRDPAMRSQILALRFDPEVASLMAGEFARDNGDALRSATGREPNATDLYLAHFLGPAGASDFLRNLQVDPNQSAASLFPKAAASNHAIFFGPDGASRTLAGVYGLFQTKLDTALVRNGGGDQPEDQFAVAAFGPGATPDASMSPPPSQTRTRTVSSTTEAPPSMAEMLRTTFAVDPADTSPSNANVRKAYNILREFNL